MRVLVLSAGNSLSHVAKSLAAREALVERGHEVHVAVSRERSPFLARLKVPHHVLPDLQEADLGPAPSVAWFKRPERFVRCVEEEVALIRRLHPKLVLGVFRFTAVVSARAAGVPCDTLACGCMLPSCREPLGFEPGEPGSEKQLRYLRLFQDVCAPRVNRALARLGQPEVSDIRRLLMGRRTFLWDPPEFFPLAETDGVRHVGPFWWSGWPRDGFDLAAALKVGSPLALITFGTGKVPGKAVERLVAILLRAGYGVVLAAGGQAQMLRGPTPERRFARFDFVPLGEVLPHADLLICHGGQATVFEALREGVPVAVMPFQPEQAHNGLCLERLGCGARLIPSVASPGDPYRYLEALDARNDGDLAAVFAGLRRLGKTGARLKEISAIFERYDGARALARELGTDS